MPSFIGLCVLLGVGPSAFNASPHGRRCGRGRTDGAGIELERAARYNRGSLFGIG
jgi:hypothetical protein